MVNELLSFDVQVEAVRFKGNGSIFTAKVIDARGPRTGEEIVVRCPGNVLYPRKEVFKGEVWCVSGFEETYKGRRQFGAVRMYLTRPDGENILNYLAFTPKFKGLGEKKARDLWATFGEDLYDILDSGDVTALSRVIGPEVAENAVSVWQAEHTGELYRWLDLLRVPVALGRKLKDYYGEDARTKIEEDPFRLLPFGLPWKRVDDLARRLSVAESDPRRLHAGVAAVLYRHFAEGDTAVETAQLAVGVARLLCGNNPARGHALAAEALRHTYADGAFVRTGDLWQATGVFLVEAFVADRVCRMLSDSSGGCDLPEIVIRQVIEGYEETNFVLGDEQREAIYLALKNRCSVITGGAGVGKTSVLRCICDAVKTSGGHILLMALSGRAAKRMEEASGHPAHTIAGFHHNVKQDELERLTHVVVDEASMLDVVSAYQILRRLPERACLILVGDPYQLPPIGAGLTFHVLAEADKVPVARLTKVYRQSGASGIPAIANSIRHGVWPQIPTYRGKDSGVFVCPAEPEETIARLVEIYEELGGADESENVQILSAIKADNPYGVVGINGAFHAHYTEGEEAVVVSSPKGELCDSGFRQGDKILVTKNQWSRGLFNGSIGRITEAIKTSTTLQDGRSAVAKAVIDGKEEILAQDDLEWIVHGYSISIHKAQGSQFGRVIVPVSQSKLLDRTLIYTAITRGVVQVILIGDLAAARAAVLSPPHAWLRRIGFDRLLRRRLSKE